MEEEAIRDMNGQGREEVPPHSPVLDANVPDFEPRTPSSSLRQMDSSEGLMASSDWHSRGFSSPPQRLSPSGQWHDIEISPSPRQRQTQRSSLSSPASQRGSPRRRDSRQHISPDRRQQQSRSSSLSTPEAQQNQQQHSTFYSSDVQSQQQQQQPQSTFLSSDENTSFNTDWWENMSGHTNFSGQPFWLSLFRPRTNWTLEGTNNTDSPIPQARNFAHAAEIRNALTDFHLAVALIDEEAGENTERRIQLLRTAIAERMPTLIGLGIRKHQVVFFYHGRDIAWLGNEIWDVITEWEAEYFEEQARVRREREAEIEAWNSSAARGRQGDDVIW